MLGAVMPWGCCEKLSDVVPGGQICCIIGDPSYVCSREVNIKYSCEKPQTAEEVYH